MIAQSEIQQWLDGCIIAMQYALRRRKQFFFCERLAIFNHPNTIVQQVELPRHALRHMTAAE